MLNKCVEQRTIEISPHSDRLERWLEAIITNCRSQWMSAGTIRLYRDKTRLILRCFTPVDIN
ncbi:MAG: hypothetical protein VB108_10155 [Anaerolineaceae bacterium]|nr:hypothetical protein [Anaerolineaceae bacterium]